MPCSASSPFSARKRKIIYLKMRPTGNRQECCQVYIKNGNYIIFVQKKSSRRQSTETFIHQHHIERPHKTAPDKTWRNGS